MLTAKYTLSDLLDLTESEQHEWLWDLIVSGPDFPIPADYGDHVTYLIDQLSRTEHPFRARVAEIACDLLQNKNLDQEIQQGLLQILSEVIVESHEVQQSIASYLWQTLASDRKTQSAEIQNILLGLLGKAVIHGYDWRSVLTEKIQNQDTAFAAQLALECQEPDLAIQTLPLAIETMKKANLPTAFLTFTVQDRRAKRSHS